MATTIRLYSPSHQSLHCKMASWLPEKAQIKINEYLDNPRNFSIHLWNDSENKGFISTENFNLMGSFADSEVHVTLFFHKEPSIGTLESSLNHRCVILSNREEDEWIVQDIFKYASSMFVNPNEVEFCTISYEGSEAEQTVYE